MDSAAYIKRVYASTSVEETRKAYDDWAAEYDNHMIDQNYIAPSLVAAAAVKEVGVEATFLDAGCGSGHVGRELSKLGAKVVDGVDLSPGMLDIARESGAYRNLDVADLSNKMEVEDGVYGGVVCSGTLTEGHVGPGAIVEFLRVLRPGGVMVATVLDRIWESGKYKQEVERIGQEGFAKVVSTEAQPYRQSDNTLARVVVLRKPE